MATASGAASHKKKFFSKTRFLSSDPNELWDQLKLKLREKHAGNNFDIINKEIIVIADKLLQMHFY